MRSATSAIGAAIIAALVLTACTGPSRTPIARTPSPTVSASTLSATASPSIPAPPLPAPAASDTPLPPSDSAVGQADYQVLGFDAQQVWDLCSVAVKEQHTDIERSYPGSTTVQPLTSDGVRDAQNNGAGHVAVFAPSQVLHDGQPLVMWICEFDGDPAAPHLVYASFADR